MVLNHFIQSGNLEFALDRRVQHEFEPRASDSRFRNDETGASTYDQRVIRAWRPAMPEKRDFAVRCRFRAVPFDQVCRKRIP